MSLVASVMERRNPAETVAVAAASWAGWSEGVLDDRAALSECGIGGVMCFRVRPWRIESSSCSLAERVRFTGGGNFRSDAYKFIHNHPKKIKIPSIYIQFNLIQSLKTKYPKIPKITISSSFSSLRLCEVSEICTKWVIFGANIIKYLNLARNLKTVLLYKHNLSSRDGNLKSRNTHLLQWRSGTNKVQN